MAAEQKPGRNGPPPLNRAARALGLRAVALAPPRRKPNEGSRSPEYTGIPPQPRVLPASDAPPPISEERGVDRNAAPSQEDVLAFLQTLLQPGDAPQALQQLFAPVARQAVDAQQAQIVTGLTQRLREREAVQVRLASQALAQDLDQAVKKATIALGEQMNAKKGQLSTLLAGIHSAQERLKVLVAAIERVEDLSEARRQELANLSSDLERYRELANTATVDLRNTVGEAAILKDNLERLHGKRETLAQEIEADRAKWARDAQAFQALRDEVKKEIEAQRQQLSKEREQLLADTRAIMGEAAEKTAKLIEACSKAEAAGFQVRRSSGLGWLYAFGIAALVALGFILWPHRPVWMNMGAPTPSAQATPSAIPTEETAEGPTVEAATAPSPEASNAVEPQPPVSIDFDADDKQQCIQALPARVTEGTNSVMTYTASNGDVWSCRTKSGTWPGRTDLLKLCGCTRP